MRCRIDVVGDADIHTKALDLQAQRVGKCLQSRLAAIVRGMQRSLDRPGERGYEQDVATGFDNVRQDGAHSLPRSEQIDAHDPLEGLRVPPFDRTHCYYRCVHHRHVQAPEAFHGCCYSLLKRVALGDISLLIQHGFSEITRKLLQGCTLRIDNR